MVYSIMPIPVEVVFKSNGIPYRLITLTGKIVNFKDVQKHSDGNPEDDCKCIVGKVKSGKLVAFFLRGMMRLDFKKVKKAVGEKISILSVEELKEKTGKTPGLVSVFLLKDMRIFVDQRVLERETIQCGPGTPGYGIEFERKYLEQLIDFKTADLAQE
jgi:prolyl-tRNA editing enzyme YbaK/EbsC (Cys-tRNA(Pro) deacylase)